MGNIISDIGPPFTIAYYIDGASAAGRIKAAFVDVSDPKRLKPQSFVAAADTSLIFPDDLLLEIFLRLPHAQSLLRCTAVCKRWRHLVSSSGFYERFNLYNRNSDGRYSLPYALLISYSGETCHVLFSERSKALHAADNRGLPRYLNFVPLPPNSFPRVIASCEDLLLIKPFIGLKKPAVPYVLCNPLTRQAACLPPPPKFFRCSSYAFTSTTDSTTGNTCFHVFRFHFITSNVGPDMVYTYDVFSSDTGKWDRGTVAVARIPDSVCCNPAGSALMTENGVIHVPILREAQTYHGVFLAFDPFSVEEPKRGRYVGPGLETARRQSQCIQRNFFWGLNQGRLRLTQCFGRKRAFLKIWELIYDHDSGLGSWVLIHDAEVKRLPNAKDICVNGIHQNDSAVVFLVNNREDIYEYHFVKDEYRKVGEITSKLNSRFSRKFYSQFMMSFSLIYPAWPTPINKVIGNFSV